MTFLHSLGRTRRGERGQSLVEFSLAAMIFFALVFAIFDFARLYESWVTVQHSAREAARYAVTGRTECGGLATTREACIVATAKRFTEGLNGGGSGGAAVDVSYKSWDYPSYNGAGTADDPGSQCDAVEVSVSYKHKLVFAPLQAIASALGASDGISMTGRQRMLIEPYGPCV